MVPHLHKTSICGMSSRAEKLGSSSLPVPGILFCRCFRASGPHRCCRRSSGTSSDGSRICLQQLDCRESSGGEEVWWNWGGTFLPGKEQEKAVIISMQGDVALMPRNQWQRHMATACDKTPPVPQEDSTRSHRAGLLTACLHSLAAEGLESSGWNAGGRKGCLCRRCSVWPDWWPAPGAGARATAAVHRFPHSLPRLLCAQQINSRICRNVSFQIPVEIHQTRVKGRIGCLALAEGIWLHTCSALRLISHCTVHTNAAPFEWEFYKEIVKKMQVSWPID